MKITLTNFDSIIKNKIIERGQEYFQNDQVRDIEEISPGVYLAEVKGSKKYKVKTQLEGEEITNYECNCPYDRGVCKHVAAVLYCLQEKQEKETVITTPSSAGRIKKKKSEEEQLLDKILDKLTLRELKGLIYGQCKADDLFYNSILSKYAHLVTTVSKEMYTSQIARIIDSCIDSYGYIHYSQTFTLATAMAEMEQSALQELERGNYRNALYISLAIYEEMKKALLNGDDSAGDIGSILCSGVEILMELAKKDLEENLRKDFFASVLFNLKPKDFQGWDWEYNLAHIAITLMRTPTEKEQYRNVLNQLSANPEISKWMGSSIELLVLDFIRKTEGEGAGIKYMESKPKNSRFRKELIELALASGDFDKVISLTKEGIRQDEVQAPGQVNEWYRYQLKVYEKTNNTAEILRLARLLFLKFYGWDREEDYYLLLKKHIPITEWGSYVDKLIVEIKNKYRKNYELLSQIYIHESRWEDLLNLVEKECAFYRIEAAEKYLSPFYPNELAAMYQKCILAYMEQASHRSAYQEACRYIRKMINLGAKQQSIGLIEELKKLYRRRPAMIDELNKIVY